MYGPVHIKLKHWLFYGATTERRRDVPDVQSWERTSYLISVSIPVCLTSVILESKCKWNFKFPLSLSTILKLKLTSCLPQNTACCLYRNAQWLLYKETITVYCYSYVKHKYIAGHAVAQLLEALCYKLKGRGFDSQWCLIDIKLPAALWLRCRLSLRQKLGSTKNISWRVKVAYA